MPCEILVLNFDPDVPDITQLANCWQSGHVIDIKPEGWSWGDCETDPNRFVILSVDDLEVEDAQDYLSSLMVLKDLGQPLVLAGIRKWKFDLTSLAAPPSKGKSGQISQPGDNIVAIANDQLAAAMQLQVTG